MSDPEALAWESLRPWMQALSLDPQRVENLLGQGTPDVWYADGALELKALHEWPKRAETPVRVEFRPGQVPWLLRRWQAGGAAWVMLRVGAQWLLFAAPDAGLIKSGLSAGTLTSLACWRSAPVARDTLWGSLGSWLRRDHDALLPPARARLLRHMCNKTMAQAAIILGTTPEAVCRAELEEGTLTNDLIDAWVA